MSNIDPYDAFASSGAATAKFPTVGTTVKGTFISMEYTQQRDFVTGKPAFWDDQSPKMQFVITLATDERDPNEVDDDGMRRLYAKKGGSMHNAIFAAVQKAQAGRLEPGGILAVRLEKMGPPPKPGLNEEKIFVAEYKRPTADVSAGSSESLTADGLI